MVEAISRRQMHRIVILFICFLLKHPLVAQSLAFEMGRCLTNHEASTYRLEQDGRHLVLYTYLPCEKELVLREERGNGWTNIQTNSPQQLQPNKTSMITPLASCLCFRWMRIRLSAPLPEDWVLLINQQTLKSIDQLNR